MYSGATASTGGGGRLQGVLLVQATETGDRGLQFGPCYQKHSYGLSITWGWVIVLKFLLLPSFPQVLKTNPNDGCLSTTSQWIIPLLSDQLHSWEMSMQVAKYLLFGDKRMAPQTLQGLNPFLHFWCSLAPPCSFIPVCLATIGASQHALKEMTAQLCLLAILHPYMNSSCKVWHQHQWGKIRCRAEC